MLGRGKMVTPVFPEPKLAEAGCTVHEIAAITGHVSLREVERYTKAFDRERLARSAMARMAAEMEQPAAVRGGKS
jgi:hypothetical protein